jgi:hypothetical protein
MQMTPLSELDVYKIDSSRYTRNVFLAGMHCKLLSSVCLKREGTPNVPYLPNS